MTQAIIPNLDAVETEQELEAGQADELPESMGLWDFLKAIC